MFLPLLSKMQQAAPFSVLADKGGVTILGIRNLRVCLGVLQTPSFKVKLVILTVQLVELEENLTSEALSVQAIKGACTAGLQRRAPTTSGKAAASTP